MLLTTLIKINVVQIGEISNTILIAGGDDSIRRKTSSEVITANSTCFTVDLNRPIYGNALITVEGPNRKAVRFNCEICF